MSKSGIGKFVAGAAIQWLRDGIRVIDADDICLKPELLK